MLKQRCVGVWMITAVSLTPQWWVKVGTIAKMKEIAPFDPFSSLASSSYFTPQIHKHTHVYACVSSVDSWLFFVWSQTIYHFRNMERNKWVSTISVFKALRRTQSVLWRERNGWEKNYTDLQYSDNVASEKPNIALNLCGNKRSKTSQIQIILILTYQSSIQCIRFISCLIIISFSAVFYRIHNERNRCQWNRVVERKHLLKE